MLAFIAHFDGEEWCTLIHGETRGKAKSRFYRVNPSGPSEPDCFPLIRLKRLPGQDDKPFTYQNAKAAGFEYRNVEAGTDEDGYDIYDGPEDFTHECDCEICRI